MSTRITRLVFLGAITGLAGCMTSASTPTHKPDAPFVSSMELSETVGHVGKPFLADVRHHAHRLGTAEYSVRSLPAGLRFDAEKQQILGVPKGEGFFSVTVAVRKKRKPGLHFDTVDGAWHSERFEIAIYRPLSDADDGGGWSDEPVASVDEIDIGDL